MLRPVSKQEIATLFIMIRIRSNYVDVKELNEKTYAAKMNPGRRRVIQASALSELQRRVLAAGPLINLT